MYRRVMGAPDLCGDRATQGSGVRLRLDRHRFDGGLGVRSRKTRWASRSSSHAMPQVPQGPRPLS